MKQRYDSYKPSSIDWIGEIPSHWTVMPVKYVLDNLDYLRQPISAEDRERNNPQYDYYGASGVIDQIDYYNVEDTVLLIGEDGANLVMRNLPLIYKASGKFWVNNHAHILKPQNGYDYSYLAHLLEAGDYTLFITGSAQPKLSQENLNKYPICIPPLAEQEAIAAWLDEKCGEIDAAIAKVDREIELIDELKQSEISRVVTRGLNPDAPLRPSGIDWIGDVPEHWEICRIKHKADVVLGKMLLNEPPKEQRNIYSKEKYLKSRNIGWLNLLLDEVDEMWFNESEKSLYKLNDGDVLVNEGGDIGKVAIWHNQEDSFYIQNSVHKISPIGVTSGFLVYWIFSLSKRDYFWSIVSQVSIAHLTKEKLSNTPLIVPPLSEQQAIADYLDKKCAEIDGLKAKLSRKHETLTELRQSIISEVVTGKRKVI